MQNYEPSLQMEQVVAIEFTPEQEIAALEEFRRTMREEVIPEIVEAVYRRQVLAVESRKQILRVWNSHVIRPGA